MFKLDFIEILIGLLSFVTAFHLTLENDCQAGGELLVADVECLNKQDRYNGLT